MTLPRMKPCPNCRTDEHLELYSYENGWRHVECLECNKLGPGAGSKLGAIRLWNDRAAELGRAA